MQPEIYEKEPKIERELTTFEKSLFLIDNICRVNAVIHACIQGNLTQKALRAGLDSIQARHPLLRVRIIRKGWAGLYFESGNIPKIPLRIVEAPEDFWVKEAEYECNTYFTPGGPLARCVLVRHTPHTSTVILCLHHSITDGKSIAYLLRDLIHSASGAIAGHPSNLPELTLKQGMEDFYPAWTKKIKGRIRFFLHLFRLLGAMIRLGAPKKFKWDRWTLPGKRQAFIIAHVLPSSVLESLITRARNEKTTVHGALTAALILAVAKEQKIIKKSTFTPTSEVDMRKYLISPIEDDLIQFSSVIVWFMQAHADSDFWEIARQNRESILRSIEREEQYSAIAMLRCVEFLTKFSGTGRIGSMLHAYFYELTTTGAIDLSNIGSVDIPAQYGDLSIETLGCLSSLSTMSAMAAFSATLNNRLALNFTGMEPLVSRSRVERIANSAIQILKDNLVFTPRSES
ncbi:MAG: hypothetical protein KJ737_03690 [Proteobacteria bacterium]|nr:hypothetical protein [Pseudomonadota bacterium]